MSSLLFTPHKDNRMRIATWNLNNRVGRVRFRPDAAKAVADFDADVLVLTEYFPQEQHDAFAASLIAGGWKEPLLSSEPAEKANRVLITARTRFEPVKLSLPDQDEQFPANMLAVRVPEVGISILGLRVPYYSGDSLPRLRPSWDWIEAAAAAMVSEPSVIVGDLNVRVTSTKRRCGDAFRRMLESGWRRANPTGPGGFMKNGKHSEIDHLLASKRCEIRDAFYITTIRGFTLAGTPEALSDHALLVADVVPRSAA